MKTWHVHPPQGTFSVHAWCPDHSPSPRLCKRRFVHIMHGCALHCTCTLKVTFDFSGWKSESVGHKQPKSSWYGLMKRCIVPVLCLNRQLQEVGKRSLRLRACNWNWGGSPAVTTAQQTKKSPAPSRPLVRRNSGESLSSLPIDRRPQAMAPAEVEVIEIRCVLVVLFSLGISRQQLLIPVYTTIGSIVLRDWNTTLIQVISIAASSMLL